MPSSSNLQQKLFGVVYAYQRGKIPADKVGSNIKKIAKTISPEDAKKYARSTRNIKEIIQDIVETPKYTEQTIREIVESKVPGEVKGQVIDSFTAQLLCTVMDSLDEHNKNKMLDRPLNEMVAVSYKILTF